MRWILRLSGAVFVMALVALLVNRATIRAGGGIPGEGEKKTQTRGRSGTSGARRAVPPERTSTQPARRSAALVAEVRRLRAAQVVPRDALFYATIADLSQFRSASKELALAKILAEPAISSRLSRTLEALRGAARDAPGEGLVGFIRMALTANVDYSGVKPLFRKELSLVGLRPHREGGDVRLAVVAVVGPNREPLTEVIDNLIGEIIDRYPQTTHAPLEERGATKIRGLKVGSYQICYACYENLLIVGTGKGTVGELIDTCAAGEAKQLAGDPEFKKTSDELGKGALLFYRVDLREGTAKSLRSLVPEEAGDMVGTATGLLGTGMLWGGVYPDGAAIRERMEVRTRDKAASTLGAGGPLPMPPRSLKYFSVDTAVYAAFSRSLADFLKDIKKNKAALDAAPGTKGLTGAAAALGLSDSLSAIGGELAAGIVIPHGRSAERIVVLQVKRRDLLDEFEKVIEKGFEPRKFKEERFRRHTIHYSDAPKEGGEAGVGKMLLRELAYVRTRQEGHEFLLIASGRRALRKAIRQPDFEKSCLAEKEDFKRCLGNVRPRWTSAVYAGAPYILELLRGSMSGGSGGVEGKSLSDSEVAAIAPHLFGLGVVSDRSANVSFRESYGPVGPATGATIRFVAALQAEAASKAPKSATADAANLATIGVGLQLYATDFDRFPSRLSELHDEYIRSLDYFNSPGGKGQVKAKDDIDTKSDYVYVRGVRPTDLSGMIVAYTKKHVQGGRGRYVLFLDGRVVDLRETGFQSALKAQAEAMRRR
jgi:hypothetical protein